MIIKSKSSFISVIFSRKKEHIVIIKADKC